MGFSRTGKDQMERPETRRVSSYSACGSKSFFFSFPPENSWALISSCFLTVYSDSNGALVQEHLSAVDLYTCCISRYSFFMFNSL